METSHVIIILILLGCMATYIPVFMSLFFTAVLGFLLFTDLPLMLLAQTLFRSMDNFALVVVLFFILCGNIMTTGTIVEKIIKMANALVSWLPGGLGMAGVIACALFGAISGSTVATVVALGGFMIPALIAKGYPTNYSVGIMTTSGNLGVIIPPSISMILYCMISNVSLEGLFLTGYVPGILIAVLTCGYTYFLFRKDTQIVRTTVGSAREMLQIFKEGFWSLMLPVIIFVGIFSGIAAAVTASFVNLAFQPANREIARRFADQMEQMFPNAEVIDRTTMNSWEDGKVTDAINRIGKDRIVFAGLWTSVCIVGPALSALDQGFEVYVIADACGDVTDEAHERAMQRMIQAGVRPMTSLQYLLELQRDWARGATYALTTGIARVNGGSYGIGIDYAVAMFGGGEGGH